MSTDNNMEKTNEYDDSMVYTLSNGVKVLSTTWHSFIFEDETEVEPSGVMLNADFGGNPLDLEVEVDVDFVTPTKLPREDGLAFLATVPEGVLVVGSAVAAEAYGYPVVSTVPTPDSIGRGADKDQKRVRIDQFNCWS